MPMQDLKKINKISLNFINKHLNEYEASYLELIQKIVNFGELRCIRGGNVYTIFGTSLEIDISSIDDDFFKFPMLTHRKVGCKNMIEEILWILRGDIDIKKLQERKVNIWNGNASEDFLKKRNLLNKIKPNFIGPMYGYQIRHFNAPFKYLDENTMDSHKKNQIGFDQLKSLINKIKRNPYTRTMLMTTFNPAQVDEGCLYPCTGIIIHFHVDNDGKLHQIMYQRSCDFLIGVPHNICLYAILNFIIARIVGLKSGTLKCFFGDSHVYEYHLPIFNANINNKNIELYSASKLYVPKIKSIDDIENLSYDNFKCIDYKCSNKVIKYPMFVGSSYQSTDKHSNDFSYANYGDKKNL